ncbi:uncharacterized protein LOC117147678 [Drosophila mauritiana]|uniref:Uncharacterized protein LOC117147678 n=1 Tax=Drosophila mauritiana TaxID=7226 RepID=A0A6P8KNF0_DROMA|nr:uncharacterized protein LOC117147678 [Drosophila mauritiana]
MCWVAMARKDDPVFNVRFVQFVENQPCLWNYTHPGYSKKEEVQRAWQQVANDIKDTVRNCRERWRTIRSSFLRSLKLARTQTGRGKRKYYLSKYMQFLVPFTKSRSCHKQLPGMVLRKPGQAATIQQEDEVVAEEEEEPEQPEPNEMPLDVQMSEEEQLRNQEQDREPPTACLPLRLQTIKVEQDSSNANQQLVGMGNQQLEGMGSQQSLVSVPAASLGNHLSWSDLTQWVNGHVSGHHKLTTPTPTPPPPPPQPTTCAYTGGPGGGGSPPDADYSFLISLHPYIKEMNGKQNRKFRQKVVGLIDDILDNKDV